MINKPSFKLLHYYNTMTITIEDQEGSEFTVVFNPIWTGLFANLERLVGGKMAPLLTWLFQVR